MSIGATPPRHRVVLADDSADVRLLVATALDLDGAFEVVGEAADGVEAIAVTRRTQPDAVVLDLVMPRLDGLTAIPEVRVAAPGCRVVVLTALDDAGLTESALWRGAHACVAKELAFTRLSSVLRELLACPVA